jgi:nickel-dependent lactate racemase
MGSPLPDNLPFGTGSLAFTPDFRFRFDVLQPRPGEESPGRGTPAELIQEALDHPLGTAPLAALERRGGRVAIVVPDATRAAGADLVLPPLLKGLLAAGVNRDTVTILVATGIHRPVTAGELRKILGPGVADSFPVVNHQADRDAAVVTVGRSSTGTAIRLNRLLVQAELKILLGAVGLHYFAGFTGGRKAVLPGLAHRETIFANHLKVLGGTDGLRHPAVGPARLEGNPVHQEMLEAAEMAGIDFIVNTVLDDHGRVAEVFAGHLRQAHLAACERVRLTRTIDIDARRPLVVASAGGHPKDINMIQAHKAMEYAVAALEEGGVLLLAARCEEGPGHPDFFPWFAHRRDVEQMASRLRSNYQVYGQTALALTAKARRFRVGLVSGMPGETVAAMGMKPLASLEDGMDWAASQLPHGSPAWLMPHAGSVLPVLAQGA